MALAARWRVGLLVLVSTLVWCAHYDRWTAASWGVPTNYNGDTLEILARIAAAAEGDTKPMRPQIISRLGAPFGANWSAYPASDMLLVLLIGQIAKGVGVFTAANIALWLATVTSALAFYGCARWLRGRWEWAFAGALLFAFTFQTFHRGLSHLFLVFSWTVPMALLACGFVAGSGLLQWRSWRGGFCVATAALIGIGNPYILFLFLQLLGWAMIAQWVGPRRRENLIAGGAAMVTAFVGFFLVGAQLWLFTNETGEVSPLIRNYGSTERYALKPIELFLPPASHRWDALAFFGNRYERWSEWRNGESFAPYLGIVAGIGLVWLAVTVLRAILQRRRLPGYALPAGWVLVFSSVGGLTNIMAFFTGLVLFRATNRFSIFISAIALLFIVSRMTRWWANRSNWGSLAAAALVTIVGVMEQLPESPGLEKQAQIAGRIEADRELGDLLEGKLKPHAMVFQLPVVSFPESLPTHKLGDYEHFRMYLATRSLRFSYGILRGRSRMRWQRDAENLPMDELVKKIERYGFSALYFSRKGFADGGESLLRELDAMGRKDRVEGKLGELVVVFLRPALKAAAPFSHALTFGHGWQSASPGEPRWAHGPATFSFYNPFPDPVAASVRLVVGTIDERHLTFRINREETPGRTVQGERVAVTLEVIFRPGYNRIDVASREPAVRLSQGRGQLRAFAVHETAVKLDVAPDDDA